MRDGRVVGLKCRFGGVVEKGEEKKKEKIEEEKRIKEMIKEEKNVT